MIEERGIRFLLTGSSARALKRKGVNMLGGRGSDRVMHPFSWSELGERSRSSARSTPASSRRTTCPTIRTRDWRRTSTATSPRRSPPRASSATCRGSPAFSRRRRPPTRRCSTTPTSAVTRRCRARPSCRWYEVLRDTLIAFELPAWSRTVKRKAIETAEFCSSTPAWSAPCAVCPGQRGLSRFRRVLRALPFSGVACLDRLPAAAHASRVLALPIRIRGRFHPRRPGRDRSEGGAARPAQAPCGVCGRSPRSDSSSDPSIVTSVSRVPDDWMSPSARAFGIALMRYNRAQLGELVQ